MPLSGINPRGIVKLYATCCYGHTYRLQVGEGWNKPNYKCIHVLVNKSQSLKTHETSQGQLHYMAQCSDQTEKIIWKKPRWKPVFLQTNLGNDNWSRPLLRVTKDSVNPVSATHALLDTHIYANLHPSHVLPSLSRVPVPRVTIKSAWTMKIFTGAQLDSVFLRNAPTSVWGLLWAVQDLFGRFICTFWKYVGVNAPWGWLWIIVGFMNLWISYFLLSLLIKGSWMKIVWILRVIPVFCNLSHLVVGNSIIYTCIVSPFFPATSSFTSLPGIEHNSSASELRFLKKIKLQVCT